ncbi:hypothetical protein FE257_003593 [Aspergillus nanangensis]|uniref:F-box domain-containing protein n=1 Tax=Aspergillus nanangensis TaxID=2582783 RepID=A0AAD4GW71_ASPNN|nr:hypothetical protein FE257_003593 [Aspergillus nanangensis]
MTWPHVPQEILEEILGHLDLASIRYLRLANKTLSETCFGPYFTPALQHLYPCLTESRLISLKALPSRSRVLKFVRDLTVRGMCLHTPVEKEPSLDEEAKVLRYICINPTHARLNSDYFDASVTDQSLAKILTAHDSQSQNNLLKDLISVFQHTAQIQYLTYFAAVQSRLALSKLSLYTKSPGCSTSCSDLATIADLGSGDLGKSVHTLELRISTETVRPEDEESLAALARFLQLFPNIRQLDIHFERTRDTDVRSIERMWEAVAQHVFLGELRRCFLCGFQFRNVTPLMRFIRKHQATIERLNLRYNDLLSGDWAELVNPLLNDSFFPQLQAARFMYLSDEHNLWMRNERILARRADGSLELRGKNLLDE